MGGGRGGENGPKVATAVAAIKSEGLPAPDLWLCVRSLVLCVVCVKETAGARERALPIRGEPEGPGEGEDRDGEFER